jgi:hypothetical protein
LKTATALLDEVMTAHGGAGRWKRAREITARVRSGGLLPRSRTPGTKLSEYELTVDMEKPRAVLDPYPAEGQRGVFQAGEVRIEDGAGQVLESRELARESFYGASGLRRNLRWDALDTTYFAGYAMWNYMTTPYLLTRSGIDVREGEDWEEGEETWRRLEVTFPDELDTHSREQTFYVDRKGLIRRQDYTAEVVSRFANAAHYCGEHKEFSGLTFPTKRRVLPRAVNNRSLPGPTLVWIELAEVEVH